MFKEMRFESNPVFLRKYKHVLIKLSLLFLLMGITLRLLFDDSFRFSFSSDEEEKPSIAEQIAEPPLLSTPIPEGSLENGTQTAQKDSRAKCDIFVGKWIEDPKGPAYTNESCNVIESHQNCMKNGRPDSGYLHWRWSPRDCKLPRFDPVKFLDLMRNKSWAFIGDSIQRNHVQSLLCLLSQVEQAIEIYHDEAYKSKKWHFPSHNFTLSVIWAPFLTKASIFEDINGVSTAEIQLHLDKLDRNWTTQYNDLDYVVIACGKWFLKTAIYYENNTITGCHYCPGKNLTDFEFEYAYRKAINFIFNFITDSNHKPLVFFRTTTPDHFENGEWFSGGKCNRIVPYEEGEVDLKDTENSMRSIELEEFEKVAASGKGLNMELLDTTKLSLMRPDGHPGPYRQFQPFGKDKKAQVQYDCLHWCLPGPIDSWNDLVMELLIHHKNSQ